ncbi:HNH endonuclease [[Ruminococcus] torques]
MKSIKADNECNTIMLAKHRKTLAVCPNCYAKITK